MSGLADEKSQKRAASQVSHVVKQIWCLKGKPRTSRNKYLKIIIIFAPIHYSPATAEEKMHIFLCTR